MKIHVVRRAPRRPSRADRLLDGDLLGGRNSRLGNDDRENAVLQVGLDIVLVDTAGEGKGALELANRALAGPVAVAGLVGLGLVASLGHSAIIITGGLVGVSGVVLALGATLHDQGVGVGELNTDVLLGNAGQLAIQVVGVLTLADIEAWLESAGGGGLAARPVQVVVIQQTEERGKVAARREAGAEQRHDVELG